jgi:sulfoxide reductase heme-binding subunit YedZ
MLRTTLNRALMHISAKPLVWLLCLAPLASLVLQLLQDNLGLNPAEALIRSTGDWALRALCLALAVTPLRKLSGLSAFSRMRRLLGLFAFFYTSIHAISYALLDMGWHWASIWTDVQDRPFIFMGMLALILLLLLTLTSPKAVLKILGAARWQRLHRTVHLAAWLALLHFYWIRLGKNNVSEVVLYAVIFLILLLLRIYYYLNKRRATGILHKKIHPDL